MQERDQKLYTFMRAFQIAAEEAESLVFVYDLRTQTITVDERTAQVFGVAQEQPGVPYDMVKLGVVAEESVAEYLRIHEAMLGGAAEAEGIVRLVTAGAGETVQELKFRAIVTPEGEPTGMAVGVYHNVTEDMEERDTYNRLQRVWRGMQSEYIGIFEIDFRRELYTILSYNGDFKLPLSRQGSYHEALKTMSELVIDREYQEEFEAFAAMEHMREVLSCENRMEMEYLTSRADRAWRRTVFYVTEREEDGSPATAAMYQLDIDRQKVERLRQQDALRDAYRYAESASAAKSEFLSRMSHDIRTPMNAIIGMTAIAGTHLHEPERVEDCLNKIGLASRHLLGLINEVLDMSKIESGALELQEGEFDLALLMDDTLALAAPLVREHNHELQVTVSALKHEKVIGDSLRLQQAFINLISNAVKYTPDGGCIHITVQERPSHSHNYGEYEFVFEDNGIGMSEEFQKVLFEPFTRAEDSRLSQVTGTGLGMTITRNLIRMMDGEIRVDSRLGQGTRFTVTIHLKFLEEDIHVPRELLHLPVLLVDDDQTTCESACLILNEIGMEGEWCLSGYEALERVKERLRRGESYFAVILDWKMPGMSGVETARELRKLVDPQTPILFLTACDWSGIEEEAREAGVTHFLSKPLFKSRLLNSFRCLLEPVKEREEEAPGLNAAGSRVLLAEDNELNAEIAGELLELFGVQTEWAKNGSDAVEMFRGSPCGYYELVLMDIQMPVMNGCEAARAIRDLDRPDAALVPIVAMTANAFAEDVNRSLQAGMNEHISKPVDVATLERVLRRYLQEEQKEEKG